jgi:hypothetical protein
MAPFGEADAHPLGIVTPATAPTLTPVLLVEGERHDIGSVEEMGEQVIAPGCREVAERGVGNHVPHFGRTASARNGRGLG